MQELERDRTAVKQNKPQFDDSKLTHAQKEAVAIARLQGKDLSLTIKDLKGNMDPQAVCELMDVVMDLRKRPAKPRTF